MGTSSILSERMAKKRRYTKTHYYQIIRKGSNPLATITGKVKNRLRYYFQKRRITDFDIIQARKQGYVAIMGVRPNTIEKGLAFVQKDLSSHNTFDFESISDSEGERVFGGSSLQQPETLSALKHQIREKDKEVDRLAEEVHTYEKRLDEYEKTDIDELRKVANRAEGKIAGLEGTIKQIEARHSAEKEQLQDKIRELGTIVEQRKDSIFELEDELKEAREERDAFEEAANEISSKYDDKLIEIQELEEFYETKIVEKDEKIKELEELREKRIALAEDPALAERAEKLDDEKVKLEEDIRAKEEEIEKYEIEIKDLRKKLEIQNIDIFDTNTEMLLSSFFVAWAAAIEKYALKIESIAEEIKGENLNKVILTGTMDFEDFVKRELNLQLEAEQIGQILSNKGQAISAQEYQNLLKAAKVARQENKFLEEYENKEVTSDIIKESLSKISKEKNLEIIEQFKKAKRLREESELADQIEELRGKYERAVELVKDIDERIKEKIRIPYFLVFKEGDTNYELDIHLPIREEIADTYLAEHLKQHALSVSYSQFGKDAECVDFSTDPDSPTTVFKIIFPKDKNTREEVLKHRSEIGEKLKESQKKYSFYKLGFTVSILNEDIHELDEPLSIDKIKESLEDKVEEVEVAEEVKVTPAVIGETFFRAYDSIEELNQAADQRARELSLDLKYGRSKGDSQLLYKLIEIAVAEKGAPIEISEIREAVKKILPDVTNQDVSKAVSTLKKINYIKIAEKKFKRHASYINAESRKAKTDTVSLEQAVEAAPAKASSSTSAPLETFEASQSYEELNQAADQRARELGLDLSYSSLVKEHFKLLYKLIEIAVAEKERPSKISEIRENVRKTLSSVTDKEVSNAVASLKCMKVIKVAEKKYKRHATYITAESRKVKPASLEQAVKDATVVELPEDHYSWGASVPTRNLIEQAEKRANKLRVQVDFMPQTLDPKQKVLNYFVYLSLAEDRFYPKTSDQILRYVRGYLPEVQMNQVISILNQLFPKDLVNKTNNRKGPTRYSIPVEKRGRGKR